MTERNKINILVVFDDELKHILLHNTIPMSFIILNYIDKGVGLWNHAIFHTIEFGYLPMTANTH